MWNDEKRVCHNEKHHTLACYTECLKYIWKLLISFLLFLSRPRRISWLKFQCQTYGRLPILILYDICTLKNVDFIVYTSHCLFCFSVHRCISIIQRSKMLISFLCNIVLNTRIEESVKKCQYIACILAGSLAQIEWSDISFNICEFLMNDNYIMTSKAAELL